MSEGGIEDDCRYLSESDDIESRPSSDGEDDGWELYGVPYGVPVAEPPTMRSDGAEKRRTGRPSAGDVDTDFFRACCYAGFTRDELMREFDINLERVKYLKRTLGCTWLRLDDSVMPSYEQLWWYWTNTEDRDTPLSEMKPMCRAVSELASFIGCSIRALRRHMARVNFDPKHQYSLQQVKDAIALLHCEPCCNSWGITYCESRLLTKFNMRVRRSVIKAALKDVDPAGHSLYSHT